MDFSLLPFLHCLSVLYFLAHHLRLSSPVECRVAQLRYHHIHRLSTSSGRLSPLHPRTRELVFLVSTLVEQPPPSSHRIRTSPSAPYEG